jgi:hypothetical protein
MGTDTSSRRRWFGALTLIAAMLMLVAGETLLKGRLSGFSFVVYWLACFGLTGTAMAVAILDLRAIRQRTQNEQRLFLEKALKEIETKSHAKPRLPGKSS